ncbi:hypothetical protein Sjap_005377 [Stephania japonica]|uniref:Uncharacterized protein n=1 Tax=Stephania japonica TaxID=461633 RepID=A0AAP0K5J4_9MAGN
MGMMKWRRQETGIIRHAARLEAELLAVAWDISPSPPRSGPITIGQIIEDMPSLTLLESKPSLEFATLAEAQDLDPNLSSTNGLAISTLTPTFDNALEKAMSPFDEVLDISELTPSFGNAIEKAMRPYENRPGTTLSEVDRQEGISFPFLIEVEAAA